MAKGVKDLFANEIEDLLKEASQNIDSTLVKRWNVPSAIVGIVKEFWLGGVRRDRENELPFGRGLEWCAKDDDALNDGTYGRTLHRFDKVWRDTENRDI